MAGLIEATQVTWCLQVSNMPWTYDGFVEENPGDWKYKQSNSEANRTGLDSF